MSDQLTHTPVVIDIDTGDVAGIEAETHDRKRTEAFQKAGDRFRIGLLFRSGHYDNTVHIFPVHKIESRIPPDNGRTGRENVSAFKTDDIRIPFGGEIENSVQQGKVILIFSPVYEHSDNGHHKTPGKGSFGTVLSNPLPSSLRTLRQASTTSGS